MTNTRLIAAAAAGFLMLNGLAAGAKQKLITGIEASQRVNELTTEIPWYHSLGQAEAIARKQGKMVFWVQMLGDMAGAT